MYTAMAGRGSVFSPVVGTGANLPSLRKLELAADLLASHERTRGRRFRWVVFSRLDMEWVADHPKLSLLAPDHIWIPHTAQNEVKNVGRRPGVLAGEFVGNTPDWHATMPRPLADAFMRRWGAIVTGAVAMQPDHQPEDLLAAHLRLLGVPVGRFPALAGLVECVSSWTCTFEGWRRKHHPSVRWRNVADFKEVQRYAARLRDGRGPLLGGRRCAGAVGSGASLQLLR